MGNRMKKGNQLGAKKTKNRQKKLMTRDELEKGICFSLLLLTLFFSKSVECSFSKDQKNLPSNKLIEGKKNRHNGKMKKKSTSR